METLIVRYIGPSMNPTFFSGDLLEVIPYGDHPIRPGDVVVFRANQGSKFVVHRVVKVPSDPGDMLLTRGDNNLDYDKPVPISQVMGQVVRFNRGKKWYPVPGGPIQLNVAKKRWALKSMETRLMDLFRPIYRKLCQANLMKQPIRQWLNPRIVVFHRPAGKEFQLLIRKFLIGRKSPNSHQWWIRRPFRLLFNESILP